MLPKGWYMERFPFIYNLPRFISIVPSDIKEQIFEKIVDYHKYLESSKGTIWCLWTLIRMLEFKLIIRGKGSPHLFELFFENDKMNKAVFSVSRPFLNVIDEDNN